MCSRPDRALGCGGSCRCCFVRLLNFVAAAAVVVDDAGMDCEGGDGDLWRGMEVEADGRVRLLDPCFSCVYLSQTPTSCSSKIQAKIERQGDREF